MNDLQAMLSQLRKPFHPSQVTWKPGAVKGNRALALAYADVRAYMNRLDEVCGADWSVSYEPWGDNRIICRLTIAGVVRSSTGESTNESERSEIGGTVAEAQAFKRACAMFGLGRYLYNLPSGWADYDPNTKQFTPQAKSKLTAMLVQHYRRATEGEDEALGEATSDETNMLQALNEVGIAHYGADKWPAQSPKWALWASDNRTDDVAMLSEEELTHAYQTLRKRREKAASGQVA